MARRKGRATAVTLFVLLGWGVAGVRAASPTGIPEAPHDQPPAWKPPAPTPRELEEGRALYTRALAGDAEAQVTIGLGYVRGAATERNYPEALRWFRKAAEQEHPRAQFFLGMMYLNGEGVEKNVEQAFGWHRKAAARGDSDAMTQIGQLYESGQGTVLDLSEAVRWYRRAAELGNTVAQNRLGVLYASGKLKVETPPSSATHDKP